MALVWQPRPGLVRVEVSSDAFDPRAYVAPLCRMAADPVMGFEGERACGLDGGLSLAVGDNLDGNGARAVSMVVRVPDPAPGEVGVFVEATPPGAVAGEYRVELSDPRGVAACPKVLVVGGAQKGGDALCDKRLDNALLGLPGGERFTSAPVGMPQSPPPAPFDGAGRWDEPRFCVDNDGRARSVEVDWGDITDEDGVAAVMLPEGAERGDWWSTVVDADAGNFLIVSVEPLGAAAADAPCLANSVRVVAWLSCTTERAQPMVAGNCVNADSNGVLACDTAPGDNLRYTCVAPGGAGPRLPRRDLNLLNLDDAGCRADGGELVLHIGVIREDDPAPIACGQPGDPCAAATTIPPGDCFRYRLRVRRP
ncbi:MAG: hypothetical protein H6703_08665 [Myxococcales bacterium]|nr:hypothetical protein [Myxococcales bacterium]